MIEYKVKLIIVALIACLFAALSFAALLDSGSPDDKRAPSDLWDDELFEKTQDEVTAGNVSDSSIYMLDSSKPWLGKAKPKEAIEEEEETEKSEEVPEVVEVEGGLPDFMVSHLKIDVDKKVISAKVTSLEGGSTGKNIKVGFYFFEPVEGRTYRRKMTDKAIESLNPGDSVILEFHTEEENHLYRDVMVLIDPDGEIKEKDKWNNSVRGRTKAPPPPGFLIYNGN